MANILNDSITDYIQSLHELTSVHPIQKEMEEYAKQQNFPIIGHQVGNVLALLANLVSAKRVLELGSGFGYSALWFSRALGKDGEIICTDGDDKNQKLAESYFQKAQVVTKITYLIGDALSNAKKLSGEFDIIFCDIDKHEYPAVIDFSDLYLRRGGILIIDNTLWSAKVVDDSVKDENTLGIREFNRRIFSDARFHTTLIPLRDGIVVAMKR